MPPMSGERRRWNALRLRAANRALFGILVAAGLILAGAAVAMGPMASRSGPTAAVFVPGLRTSFAPAAESFSVTFAESGLPRGSAWSVSLNGTRSSSATGSIRFVEPNGSYPFVVGSVSGYSVDPASGVVSVAGGEVNQSVDFSLNSTSSGGGPTVFGLPAETGFYLLGVVASVIFVLGISLARRSRARRRPPPPGPKQVKNPRSEYIPKKHRRAGVSDSEGPDPRSSP